MLTRPTRRWFDIWWLLTYVHMASALYLHCCQNTEYTSPLLLVPDVAWQASCAWNIKTKYCSHFLINSICIIPHTSTILKIEHFVEWKWQKMASNFHKYVCKSINWVRVILIAEWIWMMLVGSCLEVKVLRCEVCSLLSWLSSACLPWYDDFFILWQCTVSIEALEGDLWWMLERTGTKIKLALLERHETGRSKETRSVKRQR